MYFVEATIKGKFILAFAKYFALKYSMFVLSCEIKIFAEVNHFCNGGLWQNKMFFVKILHGVHDNHSVCTEPVRNKEGQYKILQ